jgi:lysophospholipase L1-like esterase
MPTARFALAASLLVLLSHGAAAAGDTAYLRRGDVVVCVGDSITAAGVYEGFLQSILDRLYPGAGIRIVNRGQGGQTAAAAKNLLRPAIDADRPTLATFMFGVNDTRWSAGDEEAKAAAFVAGLTAAVDLAATNEVVPLLLRESHFSHGKAPDEFATKVNGVLNRLLAAQDAFAAARGVPVIDTLGAYKRALATAWEADPRYEFSPDIVHPNSAGHAALAGEILRAFGAGLPLAEPAGNRGPLRLAAADDLSIEFAAASGELPPDSSLPVTVTLQNRSAVPQKGTIVLCIPDHMVEATVAVPAGASTTATLDLPLDRLRGERGATPLYAAFRGDERFAGASTLFFHARIRPAAATPEVFTAADFESTAKDARVCPLERVAIRRDGKNLAVDFTWKDATLVAARPGFKNRFGKEIAGLLDLESREGQPCDAVEILVDQRPVTAIGRPTAGADANPPGMLRVGICRVEEDGRLVPRAISLPKLPAEALSLEPAGPDAWSLKLRCEPEGPCIGVSMRVTDNDEFKPAATPLFWLTGHRGTGQEPMGFVQLGGRDAGVLYRVGY